MKFVTIKEISKCLNVKKSTLYSWTSRGMIPSHKLNGLLRFDMEEITEWIRRLRKDASGHGKTANISSAITASYDIDSIIRKAIDDSKVIKV
jgi:excisionase family DNA binding protein